MVSLWLCGVKEVKMVSFELETSKEGVQYLIPRKMVLVCCYLMEVYRVPPPSSDRRTPMPRAWRSN